jgi:hypothetical protein
MKIFIFLHGNCYFLKKQKFLFKKVINKKSIFIKILKLIHFFLIQRICFFFLIFHPLDFFNFFSFMFFFFRSFNIFFTEGSFVIGGNVDNVLVVWGDIVTIKSFERTLSIWW